MSKTTGYTIMRDDPDKTNSMTPLRDANELLLFDTPDDAFQYFRKEHYWDTKDFYLVEFHDYKLELTK